MLGKLIRTQNLGSNLFGTDSVSWYQVAPPAQQDRNAGADRAFPNGQYGVMIPQVYGRGRTAGNVIWYGDAVETAPTSGAGGSAATAPDLLGTFAVGICRGPIDHVIRIWADDLLVYDATAGGPSSAYGTITLYDGGESQDPDSTIERFEGSGNVPAYRGLAYMVATSLPLKDFGNKIPAWSFEVQAQTSASVESVLNAMAAQTGLETTDFDFGCIDQTVIGYIATARQPAKTHIDALLNVFAADLVEFDGKLQVIVRGGDAIGTIQESDLGAKLWTGNDSAPAAAVTVKRMQDVELPFRLDLNYYSEDKGYDRVTTMAVRYDKSASVQNQVTVESGLVLAEAEARQIAERLLYQQWIERTSFAFPVMPSYLRYVPAVVLNLPFDGEEVRVRFVQMDLGLFGPIGVQAVLDDTGYLIQSIAGAEVETSAPELAAPVTTLFYAFDSIEFSDADAGAPGFYVAATGAAGWRGADLYYSSDIGATYLRAGRAVARSIYGMTTSTLADGTTARALDMVSTVDVVLTQAGTLVSASEAAVRDGVNNLYLGAELLGFTTATLTDAPTRAYRLSGLVRGLRHTDMTGHSTGEKFAIGSAAVVRVPVPVSLIGSTVLVKAVTIGLPLSGVTAQPVLIGTPHLESEPIETIGHAVTLDSALVFLDGELVYLGGGA